jgi:hypothetical protein
MSSALADGPKYTQLTPDLVLQHLGKRLWVGQESEF